MEKAKSKANMNPSVEIFANPDDVTITTLTTVINPKTCMACKNPDVIGHNRPIATQGRNL